MSGIGLLLDVAKNSLLTHQYAMDVVSHNIANVSTEGYTRQLPVLEARRASPYGGFVFGSGVELNGIIRNSNSFIEKRLQDGNSDLFAMSEQKVYMDVMESIFNENSGRSLSNQFVDFWNAWNDLANNPSGIPERNLLVENGTLLSESFRGLNDDLTKLDQEIDNSIQAGVSEVSQLLTRIADINNQIQLNETTGNANDLRDQRNSLVNRLSEYIDLNTYEQEDGSLTVATSRGYIMVNRVDSYPLALDGSDVVWQGSVTTEIAITDTIVGGKIGGWLEMRDEIIPKYKADLEELAKTAIWETNKIHSQGIGLKAFSSVTGTYSATNSNAAMGTVNSGLDFYDKITDGSFKVWLYDDAGGVVGETAIPIDADVTKLDDLATSITNIHADITATVSNGKLQITASNNYTFGFSDDTGNILPALGINTFFKAANARDMAVNDKIISNKSYIAAARMSNNVGQAVDETTRTSTGIVTTSGPYTGTEEAIFEIEYIDAANFNWRKNGGVWTAGVMAGSPPVANVAGLEGVTVTFNGSFDASDTFIINVTASSDTYGAFALGDNTNSLAIADLQYQDVTIKSWTYERGSSPASQDVSNTTIDGYLHMLVGSIGLKSQSIGRETEYKAVIQNQMSVTRDNLSAVSLDEEMSNLIKYQHAYTAAAKLITTAEEMLDTLLNTIK